MRDSDIDVLSADGAQESLPDYHPDYCGCVDLGIASAPTCPPVDLDEALAWVDTRVQAELRYLGNMDPEYLNANGARARRAKQRTEGAIDAYVQTRDWLATGLERRRLQKGETR